jgi:hypothetical protein
MLSITICDWEGAMIDCSGMGQAFRTFFEQTAETRARESKFVIRRSKLTGAVFVQTLVFGWSEQPEAALNDLAEIASDLGVAITAQGLDERINQAAVTLFETLSQESLRWLQQRVPLDVGVLRQFTAVEILDSTCIALPATLKETYPGSGGDGPDACLKVQLLLNCLTGALEQITFETGCDPDQAYAADLATLQAGVLRLSDLGYFKLQRFQTIAERQAFFISRLDLRTTLTDPTTGQAVDLLTWLQGERATISERALLVGQATPVACRLIAVCLPQEVVDRRRQRAQDNARRKGRTLSARHLALLAWNVFMTNVPATLLSAEQVAQLYPVRWQVELVFKLWKSEFALDRVAGLRRERVLCELYAKLIGAVALSFLTAPHRLTAEAELSLIKAAHIVRRHIVHLAQSLAAANDLEDILCQLHQRLQRFGGKTKRRKTPSTLRQLERLIPPGQPQETAA